MLAYRALAKLRKYFGARNHRPSPAQWEALADIATTLQDMANGTAEPRFYLSSLDPGVGKSQTIKHFVDVLLASRLHGHVGVLICVSRLSEVKEWADIVGPKELLSVVTSDPTANALGSAKSPDDAPVLITTQQMVEKRLAERSFADANLFTFRGAPRTVRIWDEAFLPGRPISIGRYALAGILQRLVYISRDLTDDVEGIFREVDKWPSGTPYVLPDLINRHPSVSLNDILGAAATDAERDTLSDLWFMAGKPAMVRSEGSNAILDYKETLPVDLAPMVILDASGRVRATYKDMEKERGILVPLLSAPKRYDRLTVNVWTAGGSKSAFAMNSAQLSAGIAKAIETKPTERWLVVAHKSSARVGDTEKAVRSLLEKTPQDNVSFITWGNHSATNEFADIPNVILAGTLFYRASQYEALKRLAAGRRPTAGKVSNEELKETELGEHAHLILQALCRGTVRKCDGEHCQKMTAYLIASVRSGIPDALPTIFPGCRVLGWSPIPRNLKGHPLAVCAYIEEWAKTAKVGDIVTFRHLQRELGIDARTFRDEVRRSMPLLVELGALGVEEHGVRNMTGYRLVSRPPAASAPAVAA